MPATASRPGPRRGRLAHRAQQTPDLTRAASPCRASPRSPRVGVPVRIQTLSAVSADRSRRRFVDERVSGVAALVDDDAPPGVLQERTLVRGVLRVVVERVALLRDASNSRDRRSSLTTSTSGGRSLSMLLPHSLP